MYIIIIYVCMYVLIYINEYSSSRYKHVQCTLYCVHFTVRDKKCKFIVKNFQSGQNRTFFIFPCSQRALFFKIKSEQFSFYISMFTWTLSPTWNNHTKPRHLKQFLYLILWYNFQPNSNILECCSYGLQTFFTVRGLKSQNLTWP